MADLTSNLIVRLIDRVSGPASAAGRAIRGMRQQVAGAGGAIATAQANVRAAIDTNTQRMDAMRGRMFDAAAGAYVLTKAISAPIRAAMDFESAMADVRKVVDFDTPAAFKAFQTDIIAMSKTIPLAAKDLTSIVAAAGQAGIPRDELLRFTEMAAKVGVAFDISADQAGESLAKMMTGLGLSIDEVSALSDAMNHLSNNQASSASGILDVVRRVGASAKQYGFSAEEVSAFASAMLAAGAESEVAATSFRNMGKALTKGTSATDRQAGALQTLGLDATAVAKRMQEDAVGTTMDVLERIGRLPAEMQAAVSSDIFGDEARALGPLLTNLDLLRKSLGLVADESKYLGSAQREYEERAKTTANALQTFQNRITAAGIAIGNALLPGLNQMLGALAPVLDAIERLAADFPEATSAIISLTAGLIGLRIAALGAGYAGLLLRGGFLTSILPVLGLAKGVTKVGASLTRFVPRVRVFGKAMKAVPAATAATAAGMSLVDQAMTKSVAASKKASDAMVLGMSATRQAQAKASKAMIAGMSSAVTAAAVPRRGFVEAFKGIGRSAAAAIAAPVAAALNGLPAIARVAGKGIKLALIGTGIGAALVLIGAAAEWVRENWEGITVAVEAFAGEFNRSMALWFPEGEPQFVQFIGGLIEDFDTLTGKIDPDNGQWAKWGIEAGKTAVALATDIERLANQLERVVNLITKVSQPSDFENWAARVDQSIANAFEGGWSAFETWFNDINAKGIALRDSMFAAGVGVLQGFWDGMKSVVGDLIGWVAGIPGRITDALGNIDLSGMVARLAAVPAEVVAAFAGLAAQLTAKGAEATQGLWNGMKSVADEVIGWVAEIPGRIIDSIGSIDLSSIIQWPAPPAWVEAIGETVGSALRAVVEGGAAIVTAVAEWGRAVTDFVAQLAAVPSEVVAAFAGLAAQLTAKGAEAIQGLWDGMVAKFTELIDWVAGIPGRIVAAIGRIDLSNIIKWPTMPAWLGGSIGAGKASPTVSGASELPEAKAKGGPVTAGRPYIVGEKRPELFVPSSSGTIRPKVPGGGFTYAPNVNLTVHEAVGDIRTAFDEFSRRMREDAEAAFRAHFGDDMETA